MVEYELCVRYCWRMARIWILSSSWNGGCRTNCASFNKCGHFYQFMQSIHLYRLALRLSVLLLLYEDKYCDIDFSVHSLLQNYFN